MSLPAEASPLIKVAVGPYDLTNQFSAVPMRTARNPHENRSNPFAYKQDWMQRMRNPFGLQNSIWDGRGSKGYGVLNEANEWINPISWGSRAVEDLGHAGRQAFNTFDQASTDFANGQFGRGLINLGAGGASTAGYGLAAGTMGALGYQMRHAPMATLRLGTAGTAAAARAGIAGLAKGTNFFISGGAYTGPGVRESFRNTFKAINEPWRNQGYKGTGAGRFLSGRSQRSLVDEASKLLPKVQEYERLNQPGKNWAKLKGIENKLSPREQKMFELLRTQSPSETANLRNAGNLKRLRVSNYAKNLRNLAEKAPGTFRGALEAYSPTGYGPIRRIGALAKATRYLPGPVKLVGGLAALGTGMALSGSMKRDQARRDDIYQRWDQQDYVPQKGFGALLARLPQQFGGLLGGGQAGQNIRSWYQ